MQIDRVGIVLEALESIEITVWRQTRYANDTGTCLWCSTGALVMVPDDVELEWYCQATGAEELTARLEPIVQPKIVTAVEVAAARGAEPLDLSPEQRALLEIGARMQQQGFDEALVRTRRIFARIMQSKFGPLPPMVEQRIELADFHQLERWSERLFTLPRAILVVA